MRYIFRHAVIGALCSLLLPLAAHAQTGKRPDPESPAGFEYQLPLDQARKNATGGGGGQSGGGGGDSAGGSARLFGAGIVAADAGAAGSGGAGDGSDGGATDASGGSSARAGSADGERARGGAGRADHDSGPALKSSALPAPDDDGGSAVLQIGGIVLAVLLVGALMGLLLRRTLRQSGS